MTWTYNLNGSEAQGTAIPGLQDVLKKARATGNMIPGREAEDGGQGTPSSALFIGGRVPESPADLPPMLALQSDSAGFPSLDIQGLTGKSSGSGEYKHLSVKSRTADWLKRKQETREKIRTNLQKTLLELNQCDLADRVGVCGQYLVLECQSCGVREAAKVSCKYKLCPECAGIRRWKYVQKYKNMAFALKRPFFLTLTFLNVYELEGERKWMERCWKLFLKDPFVKGLIKGGLRVFETTYNEEMQTWHPHFHILYEANLSFEWKEKCRPTCRKRKCPDCRTSMRHWTYAEIYNQLKRIWQRVTARDNVVVRFPLGHQRKETIFLRGCSKVHEKWVKDGYRFYRVDHAGAVIIWNEVVGGKGKRSRKDALTEVVKYMTKVADFMDNPDRLSEFVKATHRMRQIIQFGQFFKYKGPPKDHNDRRNWDVDPFNLRGMEKIPCECKDEFMARTWKNLGLHSRLEARVLLRTRGAPAAPDPCPF